MRERLPGMRRAGGEHGPLGQRGRAPDSGSARGGRAACRENRMSTLTDRVRGVVHGKVPMGSDTRLTPWVTSLTGSAARESLQAVLGGEWDEEKTGFVVERRLDADALHGRARIGDLAARIARGAASASLFTGFTGFTRFTGFT